MTIPTTIGRYEIIDELGHGAMGSVFRARDPAMDRIVALKTILSVALASAQGDEYRQRFYREARAAGALAHPGIVPVFDVGEHEGVPFLVMEFVDGQTLADAMKKGERSSLDRVCEIGQQIADALGYAHRNGVIHRDIKPANILLTSRQAYGAERARITDFGVAKLTEGQITTTGQLLGTPSFMPPEQFTGQPIDGRTDLFSLGVILYWMATGEQPFSGETMATVSYKIVHTDPIPPSKLNPAMHILMESVILKCLAKNPADRYQTGEELAQALAELRTNTKTLGLGTAPPPPMLEDKSDETLVSTPGLGTKNPSVPPAAAVPPPPPMPQAAPQKKRTALVLAAVALFAIAGAATGYILLQHRNHPATQPPPAAATMATSQAEPVPAATATSQPEQPPPVIPATPAAPQTAPAATQNAAPKPSPGTTAPRVRTAVPAAVAFNPKTLDPKQNARLKIDLGHAPAGLAFSVEMNGKTYYNGSAGNKSDYKNLFVPPGLHEFRITVSSGNIHKVSNIVSAEFLAKKRLTLKIDLRPPAKGSPASPALDPATQVVATLKQDRFPL